MMLMASMSQQQAGAMRRQYIEFARDGAPYFQAIPELTDEIHFQFALETFHSADWEELRRLENGLNAQLALPKLTFGEPRRQFIRARRAIVSAQLDFLSRIGKGH